MGLVSELEGWFTGSTERDKKRIANAEAAHRASMNEAAKAYAAYRPEFHQAKMNALANRMAMYQPVNNIMATMYGQNFAPSYDRALSTPMSPSMLQQGSPEVRPFLEQKTEQEVMDTFGPNAPLSAYMSASKDQPEYAYGTLGPYETEAQWRSRQPPPKEPQGPPMWPGSAAPGGPNANPIYDQKRKPK